MSNYIETFILSIIQGISEFIPVSSSAHLFLLSNLSNFSSSSLLMDVSLHLGSLLAIIFYFREDLKNFFKNKSLALLIIVGSIPLIIIGYILYISNLIYYFRNIEIVAWSTLIFGILLFFADSIKVTKKFNQNLNLRNILIIGIFQVLSLIPGVSRSGIVITAGRFLNFDRYDSSKISFYLSIPALAGASVLGLKDIMNQNIEFNILTIFSIIFSFFFSYITIKYFLVFVKKFSLKVFVYYRIFLAGLIFVIIYS
tara:strand:+ start:3771 stop:4535 length:765 start_codon:yes stop_codon:yes gene_type:complete